MSFYIYENLKLEKENCENNIDNFPIYENMDPFQNLKSMF